MEMIDIFQQQYSCMAIRLFPNSFQPFMYVFSCRVSFLLLPLSVSRVGSIYSPIHLSSLFALFFWPDQQLHYTAGVFVVD